MQKKGNEVKLLMDGVQAYDLLQSFIVQKFFTEKMNPAYSKANVFNFRREGCFMLRLPYIFSFIQFFVTFLLSESM